MSHEKSICERCRAEVTAMALFCPMCGQARATSEADPLIGKVIGDRYLLRERIGQGGSGTIYLAEHITVKRKVAVKVLHDELSKDDLATERFRREATTVAQIDNEHIVEVLDFGRLDDGRLFLAMELLDGETLAQAIKRERTLPVEQALDVLTQVGEALMEAHAMGYIHRDLRPANIFLARRRGRRFVKLLDFGLAKLVEREGEAATTSLGMTFGDPCYMSPEQARGDAIDRRSDIYALGCMAYEMLTGRPPFVGKKVFDVLTQHAEAKPEPPSKRRPDLPPWLDALILRALAKRPDGRFATVYRLIEAIHEGQRTGAELSEEAATSMPAVEPPPPAPRRRPSQTDEVSPLPRPVVLAPAVASSPPADPVPSASQRVAMAAQSTDGSSSWYERGDNLAAESSTMMEAPPTSRRGLMIAGGVVALGAGLVALLMFFSSSKGQVAAGAPDAAPVVAAAAPPAPAPPPAPEPTPAPAPAPVAATPDAAAQVVEITPPPPAPAPKAPPAPKPVHVAAANKAAPHKPTAPKPAARPAPAVPRPAAEEPADEPPAIARNGPPVFDFRPKTPDAGVPAAPPVVAAAPQPSEPEPAPTPSSPPPEITTTSGDGQAAFYVKLGQKALREGNTAAATESFNKARSFDSQNADAIAGLGAVALKQGNVHDATVHLEAASRLAPSSSRIHTLRGQAYLAAGKRSEAAAAFKKALIIDPNNAAAAEGFHAASE